MNAVRCVLEDWSVVIAALSCVGVCVLIVTRFFLKPTDEQINDVKQWLLYAVTEAEKDLGNGTGKLKLRQVYDLFLQRFPIVSRMISFEQFGQYVDDALDEMKRILAGNRQINKYVQTGEKTLEVEDC